MFTRNFLIVAFLYLFFGLALALPTPLKRAIYQREPAPLDTIAVYDRADALPEAQLAKRVVPAASDINNMKAEVAVKAPDGVMTLYKRVVPAASDINNMKAEVAVKAPDGVMTLYKRKYKRGDQIPSEIATRSIDGVVEVY